MLNESDLKRGEVTLAPIPPSDTVTTSDLAVHNADDCYLDMREARPDHDDYPLQIPDPGRFINYLHVVYGRAHEDADHIALQYWLFYPYNSWERTYEGTLYVGNHHEGDWEMITIVLDKATATPQWLSCAQHMGGEQYDWNDIELVGETHPRVFIAQGSHASYAHLGRDNPIRFPHWPLDVTSDNGMALYPDEMDPSEIEATGSKEPYAIVDIS